MRIKIKSTIHDCQRSRAIHWFLSHSLTLYLFWRQEIKSILTVHQFFFPCRSCFQRSVFFFLFIFFCFDPVLDFHIKDILEKIRECGSSVTYYGGRVLNNQSPEVSPMTKAIMREIHSDNNICEVCHPNGAAAAAAAAVAAKKLYTTFCDSDKNHLGKKGKIHTRTHTPISFCIISYFFSGFNNTFFSNKCR